MGCPKALLWVQGFACSAVFGIYPVKMTKLLNADVEIKDLGKAIITRRPKNRVIPIYHSVIKYYNRSAYTRKTACYSISTVL